MATRPELWGHFGMVSSTHWLATAAGMSMLEAGGTAVDAAVAAGFALQVAEPHLNGPGGDMSLLFAEKDGLPTVLCGQGPAPAGATIEHYSSLGLELVPGAGLLAAAIPGATPAWLTLLRDHGTATLATVLEPAIALAAGGIPVLPTIARAVAGVRELFETSWTGSAALYADLGEVHRNSGMADTYRRLVATGQGAGPGREQQIDGALAAWSQGFVAEAVDAFCRSAFVDSTGDAHTGVLTGQDLSSWRPGYEQPVTTTFGDYTVAKTPAWGQGPVLLQQLRLLEQLGYAGDPIVSADGVHTVVEVMKLAFADREAWYGDPAGVDIAALLDDDYSAARAKLVRPEAVNELRPGSPAGVTPRLPHFSDAEATGQGLGEPTVPREDQREAPDRSGLAAPGDTCHVCVVDRWGNTVAATPSGGWLQSSPVIPELGFPLGTRLQMTVLEPGLPTSLTPGRRPRTTLSPSMALRDGGVEVAFGTPGGDQQDQWQLLFFLRHVAGSNLQDAIEAPSFHSASFPSSFYPRESYPGQLVIESRWPESVLRDLSMRGHAVQRSAPWSLGRLCAVSRRDGVVRAGADPRGAQAYAAGR